MVRLRGFPCQACLAEHAPLVLSVRGFHAVVGLSVCEQGLTGQLVG